MIALVCTNAFAATTYYVKTTGSNSNNGTSPSTPFLTIGKCASLMVAGDTCTVYAGTYPEDVAPTNSGSVGLPITFTVNSGDLVNVYGFDLTGKNYITIGGTTDATGFQWIGGSASFYPILLSASSHITVQSNHIGGAASGTNGPSAGECIRNAFGIAADSSYVSILNNTMAWCGQAPVNPGDVFRADGDHWLIDGNSMSHVPDFVGNAGLTNSVVRNNHAGPVDCATDFPGTTNQCHIDFIELACAAGSRTPTNNVLLEWNQMNSVTTPPTDGVHFMLAQAGDCTGMGNVQTRFNTIYNITDVLVQGDNSSTGTFDSIKTYNNTVALTGQNLGYATTFTGNTTNDASINNIYANAVNAAGGPNGIALDAGSSPTFTMSHDLFYEVGATWAPPASTETGAVYTDPKFVNAASNWNLAAGSPALQAGTSLTTVAAGDTGSGTDLIVNDCKYFSDGKGLVNADWIRVGTTNTAQISAINYSTCHITLVAGITRSAGNGVYLYKDSNGTQQLFNTNPDMGAYQAGAPAPTATLTATPLTVAPKSTFTLSWTSTNAASCSIDNGIGAATPAAGGTTSPITMTATTTYTITCDTATASVTVTQGGTAVGANSTIGKNAVIQ